MPIIKAKMDPCKGCEIMVDGHRYVPAPVWTDWDPKNPPEPGLYVCEWADLPWLVVLERTSFGWICARGECDPPLSYMSPTITGCPAGKD